MALSSCGAAAQPVAEKVFLEDTTAQSEIFGNRDVVGGKLGIRNRNKNEAISEPEIGYQIKFDDKKDADASNDVIAIRFVAAVKDLNVKAYWRRGVAGADGTELQSKSFANSGREVTNYYTSLSDGQTTITAGAPGKYADYVGFVVYSIYNIPYEANKGAYVAAYVNLVGDEDGDSDVHNNSKALAVKIEKDTNYTSKNVFAFDPTINKHFLQGTINGVLYDGGEHGLYEESGSTPDGSYAWYDNVPLLKTDSFGSFYYDHDRIFMYFGHDAFSDGTDYFGASSLSGYNTPVKAGTYDIHLSSESGKENHIFASASSIENGTTFTIRLKKGCKWDTGSATFSVYMFNNNVEPKTNTWVAMDDSNPSYYEITNYNPNTYPGLVICRMDPSVTLDENKDNNKWYDSGNHQVWNQSRDLSLDNLAGFVSYFVLKAGDPWSQNSGDYFSITND